ncbi:TolC family protein [Schlesneria sp.]|uniref:TolC family protein n=1 Tax=Schlesneria sp. TaxID=2762018 RepID=UPI002F0DF9B0
MKLENNTKRRFWLGLTLCAGLLTSGCSRNFWRSQADFDSYNLLSQKQFSPLWTLPRTTVEPDERSRFYDPYDRDLPPLPPDDEAASRYMEWVNGMRGYKSWHKFGQLLSVENPQWLANFGIAPDSFHDGYLLSDGVSYETDLEKLPTGDPTRLVPTIEDMTLGQAIELAAIHNREYQTQLENLFQSAMQLSLDQFQFQARYLFGRAPVAPSANLPGTTVPTGVLNSTTIPGEGTALGLTSAGGVSQVLPTGGQWIVGLANNTLWLFSGGQRTSSQSVLSYSLVQPLLAGAGRKFFLENLTYSERKVLYDTRTLARYRKIFFADAVVNATGGGNSATQTIPPSTGANNPFPGTLVSGIAATIASGASGSSAASSQGTSGYLGLLFQLQQVLNQHENVELLRVQTERLRELVAQTPFRRLPEGALPNGISFPPQLASKVDFSLATRRLRWKDADGMTDNELRQLLAVSDDVAYQEAIQEIYDQLRIGVTTIDVLQVANTLTNSELSERNFKLNYDNQIDSYKFFLGLPIDMQITIDRSMLKQFELTDPRLIETEGRIVGMVRALSQIDDENPAEADLRFIVDRFAKLVDMVREQGVELVEADVVKVEENMPNRLAGLLWDESKETVERMFERDQIIFRGVKGTFEDVVSDLGRWQEELENPATTKEQRVKMLSQLKDSREELLLMTQNLRVLQTSLRSELITLVKFDMSLEEAVEQALTHRLDLMNARGRVMDARRNMEVAANRLEAVLNVVAQGNLGTTPTGNHPLDFRGANSDFQIGLQMTTPLDQVQVRNAYRSSLINYQQARRAFMLLEDQVKYDIRSSWRSLMLNRQNFELTRKSLRQAALQFDINVANNLNPKTQVAGQAGTTSLGQTGLNLINALTQLLNAQNNLIRIWALYERNRINIYRDMDIMQIDERGLWIDPVYQNLGGNDSSSNLNGPANDIPPEPSFIEFESASDSGSSRSAFPGISRVNSFAPAAPETPELD